MAHPLEAFSSFKNFRLAQALAATAEAVVLTVPGWWWLSRGSPWQSKLGKIGGTQLQYPGSVLGPRHHPAMSQEQVLKALVNDSSSQ